MGIWGREIFFASNCKTYQACGQTCSRNTTSSACGIIEIYGVVRENEYKQNSAAYDILSYTRGCRIFFAGVIHTADCRYVDP